MAEILVRHVSKRFDEIEAVRDLSFDIANGEFVVLLGPTGAGQDNNAAANRRPRISG